MIFDFQDNSEISSEDTSRNYDEIPVGGAKMTFEQLLEAELKQQMENDIEDHSESNPAKKQNFLKRGVGLARFNLKENISPIADYRPSLKKRQPLVDYSKPVLKPKPKESSVKETSKPAATRTKTLPAKPTKTTPPVTRKVAALSVTSPKKSTTGLSRSKTMPSRERPEVTKRLVESKMSVGTKSTGGASKHSPANRIATGRQLPRSPVKPVGDNIPRPQSAMELSTSSHSKYVSPRKTHNLGAIKSPSKQPLKQPLSRQTAMKLSETSSGELSANEWIAKMLNDKMATVEQENGDDEKPMLSRKGTDNSFICNVKQRIQNEPKEKEELEVRVTVRIFTEAGLSTAFFS